MLWTITTTDTAGLVKNDPRTPIAFVAERRLVLFPQNTRLQDEDIDLRPHEAAITVLRRADDRFAAHVEARIYDDRTAGLPPERIDDLPVEWVHLASDGLNAGG